ncbi:MAG: BlaI/MecI/CopY family transcriptional regulator [Defluviitaleaceae bacterium]|nr:BlaI/MecI/CopY family transcriptional regulator [Defluviitaleaceae bacterium]MCL2273469.1 BlaI/MecI/CopY family transcriptional regulator [Defluviitaleaceae bacterium]
MAKFIKLTEAELDVMQVVWGLATPVTVAQLLSIFAAEKQWKTSTLSTLLARLIDKGFVKKEMQGKVNFYHAIVSHAMYQKNETKSLLANVFNGSIKNLMAALADESLTPAEADELTKWLHERADK